MKYWFHIATSLALCLGLSFPAGAADDRALLKERLAVLESFSAQFTQEVQGSRGEVLERSTGYIRLLRPKFKWVVNDPYPQTIVSEGEVLKVYDPDLEQLTIRPLEQALADTPVSLLTDTEVVLGNDFRVVLITKTEGMTFVLTPTSDETLYAEIQLHFSADLFTGIGILDHFGQFTDIRFTPDAKAAVIQSSEFLLEVPPGTDVIGG